MINDEVHFFEKTVIYGLLSHVNAEVRLYHTLGLVLTLDLDMIVTVNKALRCFRSVKADFGSQRPYQ